MKKLSMILIALVSLSLLPFTASAGYWKVKCYKPCYKCRTVCYKKWVRERDRHYHRHYRYYRY